MVADGEQLARLIVEERKIHIDDERVCALRKRLELVAQRGVSVRYLQTGLTKRDQMTGQIATVDGADVWRVEHVQIMQIVPVVEVTAVASHRGKRRQCAIKPFDHVGRCDEAEVSRADGR